MISLPAIPAEAADVRTITHGRAANLEDHLVPGKFVVFDFYADWCGPCQALEPRLNELADRHDDRLAIRKLDIINWDSAVARQYRLSSIPHLVLYGPDGSRLAAGDPGVVLGKLQVALGGGTPSRSPSLTPSRVIPWIALVVILAAIAVLTARIRGSSTNRAHPAATLRPVEFVDTAADPTDPAIWFAMIQGALEGPLTRAQLRGLVANGLLAATTDVRRRGDSSWQRISDVID
jgi:thiol-disulfide isomerase/thioredoxin